MTAIWILGLITALVTIVQIVNFRRLCLYVESCLSVERAPYTPKIAVILPCKGLDPGFADNIAKLLEQDYGKEAAKSPLEVIFAVASADDPAYPVLKQAAENSKRISIKLVVAGVSPLRAQKLNNQLAALELVCEDVEAFVFVDSDVIASPDFLRHLVAPLSDDSIGATTGYRFYVPERGDWPSLIRALWNRMSAWEMANPKFAFAWGGAMAIKRSVFERAEVAKSWERACDDDLSLTTAVKRLGLAVHFVPQCLVASHGDASLSEIIEWTNRQLILTKVYYPRLWLRAIERAVIMAVWLITIAFSLVAGLLMSDRNLLLASAVGLLILPVELLFLVKGQDLWKRVLPEREKYLHSSFWRFCVSLPLAHLILPWWTLYSVLTNRIQWRGITYELVSTTETKVVSTST